MRKHISTFIFSLLVMPLVAFSQGQINRPSRQTQHTVSQSINVLYDVNQYEPVDLGLSVKWANRNMGATKSNICGYKYGWSELTPRKAYSWKDNIIPQIISISGNPKYDLATAKLGNGWRLPTLQEMTELKTKCKWVWNKERNGYDVIGPNGNSIFMPIFEHKVEYWTGTRKDDDIHLAYNLFFTDKLVLVSCGGIGNPHFLRPVK